MGNTEVEVCDICLSMQDTKRLQVKRYRGQRYRNVCLPCISEKGLENIPEYNPTKLQEFVDEMEWDAIVPTILYDDNGKEYLGFANGQTNLLAKDKMRFIAEELLKTVELNGLAEFIENHNEKTYMIALYSRDPENTDKFLVPLDRLNIKRKQFKKNKVWGFTCGNCSTKISSKDGGEYFSISPSQIFNYGPTERACSEGCMKVIAKDIVMEWISDNDYHDDFDTDKLGRRITEHIKQA